MKQPMALLVVGSTRTGKSTLACDLGEHGIPLLRTDRLLGATVKDRRYDWSPVARINGSETNVVGLPIRVVRRALGVFAAAFALAARGD